MYDWFDLDIGRRKNGGRERDRVRGSEGEGWKVWGGRERSRSNKSGIMG